MPGFPLFVEQGADHEHKAALFIRDLFDPVLHPKKAPVERHHLFPRKYLEGQGIRGTSNINQIANLSYVEWPENIEISDTAPSVYWPRYADQFSADDLFHHALPDGWAEMSYDEFLRERRELMAQVIRTGFEAIGAPPAVAEPVEGPALVPNALVDTYLHPDRPFSNDLAIRRVVRQLRGNVLWYEQHMDRKALEILADELSLDQIDEVRLLSGPANLSAKTKKAFDRFRPSSRSKASRLNGAYSRPSRPGPSMRASSRMTTRRSRFRHSTLYWPERSTRSAHQTCPWGRSRTPGRMKASPWSSTSWIRSSSDAGCPPVVCAAGGFHSRFRFDQIRPHLT